MSFAFENLGLTSEELDQYLARLEEEAMNESALNADILEALKVSEKDRTNDVDDELAAALKASMSFEDVSAEDVNDELAAAIEASLFSNAASAEDIVVVDGVMTVSGVTRAEQTFECHRFELDEKCWSFGSNLDGTSFAERCHGAESASGDTGMCFYLSVAEGDRQKADALKASLRRADPIKHDKRYDNGVWASEDVLETYVRMTHNIVTVYQQRSDTMYDVVMMSPVGCRHPHGHVYLRKDWTHYTRLYHPDE
jgi:hypothetical protein